MKNKKKKRERVYVFGVQECLSPTDEVWTSPTKFHSCKEWAEFEAEHIDLSRRQDDQEAAVTRIIRIATEVV